MVEIRTVESLTELMKWREEVIRNVFGIAPDKSLLDANRKYYETHVADGSHVAIVAAEGGDEYGCGALCFSDELPSPDNPTGRCAYIMNIYVRERFRNNGVAHLIVARLIEAAKKRNCGKIYLETTDDGRPVYSSLGFRDMQDMMKLI